MTAPTARDVSRPWTVKDDAEVLLRFHALLTSPACGAGGSSCILRAHYVGEDAETLTLVFVADDYAAYDALMTRVLIEAAPSLQLCLEHHEHGAAYVDQNGTTRTGFANNGETLACLRGLHEEFLRFHLSPVIVFNLHRGNLYYTPRDASNYDAAEA